jgi:hypothetical protein
MHAMPPSGEDDDVPSQKFMPCRHRVGMVATPLKINKIENILRINRAV